MLSIIRHSSHFVFYSVYTDLPQRGTMIAKIVLVSMLVAVALSEDSAQNTKRSLPGLGYGGGWNPSAIGGWSNPAFGGSSLGSAFAPNPWAPAGGVGWAPKTLNVAADVAAAVAAAKEATAAAHVAQQRVAHAREQVLIQERVAAAKEAAAHAAIQRSETAAQVASAVQRSEAAAAAAAAVQKSAASAAAASAASAAAVAANHYGNPWPAPRAPYNPWG